MGVMKAKVRSHESSGASQSSNNVQPIHQTKFNTRFANQLESTAFTLLTITKFIANITNNRQFLQENL